jgi:SAM-dependent methyltransferase
VFDLITPESVVDFGCGVGTWLAVAKQLGTQRCLGLEGSWVKTQAPAMAGLDIRETDLEREVSLEERFDLAISLEVAEHLAPERAESFVTDLCKVSDVVLFSAATPGQDGDGHQNEQLPSYWAEHFIRHRYVPLDVIRPVVQFDRRVEVWYRTNIILYVRYERALSILMKLHRKHLNNLDLPNRMEVVGFKRAAAQFRSSAKTLLEWTARRVSERLRRT